jgi:hypothetical protein
VEELQPTEAADRLPRHAEAFEPALVQVLAHSVWAGHPHQMRDAFDEEAVSFLTLTQGLRVPAGLRLRPLPRGDVPGDRRETDQLPARDAEGGEDQRHVDAGAAPVEPDRLEWGDGFSPLEALLDRVQVAGAVAGCEE